MKLERWKPFIVTASIVTILYLSYCFVPVAIAQDSSGNGTSDDDGAEGCGICCGGFFAALFTLMFGSIAMIIISFLGILAFSALGIFLFIKLFQWVWDKGRK